MIKIKDKIINHEQYYYQNSNEDKTQAAEYRI